MKIFGRLNFFHFLILAGIVLAFDQITKWAVIQSLNEQPPFVIFPQYLQLIYRTNTGAAFSMFHEHPGLLGILASALALGFILVLIAVGINACAAMLGGISTIRRA